MKHKDPQRKQRERTTDEDKEIKELRNNAKNDKECKQRSGELTEYNGRTKDKDR